MRHFYASWCINRRADGGLELPMKAVQERLGHSSIVMTSDVYGHLFPQAKAEASEKFERRMLNAREEAIVSKLLANEEGGDSEEGKPKRVN